MKFWKQHRRRCGQAGLSVVILGWLVACGSPPGRVAMTLRWPQKATLTVPQALADVAATVDVWLVAAEAQIHQSVAAAAGGITIPALPPSVYALEVTAFDGAGQGLATATTTVTVQAGRTTAVVLDLQLVEVSP